MRPWDIGAVDPTVAKNQSIKVSFKLGKGFIYFSELTVLKKLATLFTVNTYPENNVVFIFSIINWLRNLFDVFVRNPEINFKNNGGKIVNKSRIYRFVELKTGQTGFRAWQL